MAELTEAKRLAVEKSWTLVDQNMKGNGINFFLAFFEAYPEYKNLFQSFKDIPNEELKDHKKLKAHSSVFMHQLSSVIRNLDDLECAAVIIKKITTAHKPLGVTNEHFVNALGVFATFLKAALGDSFDAETEEAWGTVVAIFLQVVEGEYALNSE